MKLHEIPELNHDCLVDFWVFDAVQPGFSWHRICCFPRIQMIGSLVQRQSSSRMLEMTFWDHSACDVDQSFSACCDVLEFCVIYDVRCDNMICMHFFSGFLPSSLVTICHTVCRVSGFQCKSSIKTSNFADFAWDVFNRFQQLVGHKAAHTSQLCSWRHFALPNVWCGTLAARSETTSLRCYEFNMFHWWPLTFNGSTRNRYE